MVIDRAPAWDKDRSVFFGIGLMFAIATCTLIINIETQRQILAPLIELIPDEDIIVIPRTVQEKKKILPIPPPKAKAPSIKKSIVLDLLFENDRREDAKVELDPVDPEDVSPPEVVTEQAPPSPPLPPPPPEEKDEPLLFAEQMPVFYDCVHIDEKERKVCTELKLMAFLYKHVRYPAVARENGIEGMVVAEFVVNKDGTTSEIAILRSLHPSCDREVLQVIQKLPTWMPGKQNGRPVKVLYRIPIKFKLQ